jgi:hypothetical protein
MKNLGTLSFKQKDDKGHFLYNYKISNYHAAKILEYITQIPHNPAPFRDSKGRFTKP